MHILLTGGAGHIGSPTFMVLREAAFEPLILDNFHNSSPVVLENGDALESPSGEAWSHQMTADLDFSVCCKVLFNRQFSATKAVRQIVAALSA